MPCDRVGALMVTCDVLTVVGVIWCRKLDEQTKMGDALAAHLKLQPGQAQRHALLKEYVEAGPQHLTLLLKQENHSVSIPPPAANEHLCDVGRMPCFIIISALMHTLEGVLLYMYAC